MHRIALALACGTFLSVSAIACGGGDDDDDSTRSTSSGGGSSSGGSSGGEASSSGGGAASSSSGSASSCDKDLAALEADYDTACLGTRCCDAAAACAAEQTCVPYDRCTADCLSKNLDSDATRACVQVCRDDAGGSVPVSFAGLAKCRDFAPNNCRK